jgi:hypothetical protein
VRATAAFLIGLQIAFTADVSTATPRHFLVIVDDLHLDFRDTARTRDLLRRTLRGMSRDGDLVSVVSTGPSHIDLSITTDQSVLEDAVKRVSGCGLLRSEFMDPRQRLRRRAELLRRAERAFSVGTHAVRVLTATGNSPTTILYFTQGYLSGLVRQPTELIEAVLFANAAIYPIDPRVLVTSVPSMSQADQDAYVSATWDSLRVLAEGTGGRAIFAVEDWDERLEFLKR